MPKNQKRKAFTLTELLVVVVIIGVLAAVILPKFNKVMETRKTTEAEEIMAAVRTEQEYRCSMDKPYVGDISKLSEIIPQVQTKNFTYQLETNGMLASSRGKYTYDLKMPSYADGRVCCDGAECTKLNKDYPLCDDLIARADYKASTECAAEIPVAAACVDNSGHYAGETQDTINASGCTVRTTWVSFNSAPGVCAWETTENIVSCPSCDANDPLATKKDKRTCKPDAYPTLECGEQTKGYYCSASTNYEYVAEPDSAWSECEPTAACQQETTTCGEAENTLWYDQDIDLAELCFDSGRILAEEGKTIEKGLSNAEIVNECCSCCPSGTAPQWHQYELLCDACEDIGTNYYWDSSAQGSCSGKCSQRFKPTYSNDFAITCDGNIYLPGYTKTTARGGNGCALGPIFSGSTTSYVLNPATASPCDRCDANSDTCDEAGINADTYYPVRDSLCSSGNGGGHVVSHGTCSFSYDSNGIYGSGYKFVGYTRGNGVIYSADCQIAVLQVFDQNPGVQDCGAAGSQLPDCDAGVIPSCPLRRGGVGEGGTYLHDMFFLPKYQENMRGYVCTRN